MIDPEIIGEPDPRLIDPDAYFVEKYGDVVVTRGNFVGPLFSALQIEKLARDPEKMDRDFKEVRANRFIEMVRAAGALEEVDDVFYPEPEDAV